MCAGVSASEGGEGALHWTSHPGAITVGDNTLPIQIAHLVG